MIVKKAEVPAAMVMYNGVPTNCKQELTTYGITTDEDMAEVTDKLTEGVDILLVVNNKECSYITVRKFVPQKIQV